MYSLNRTMQYGNTNLYSASDVLGEGLNRTMQYGNGAGLAMKNPIITV